MLAGLFLLEAQGENPFPCLFQILELRVSISWLVAPSSIWKASSGTALHLCPVLSHIAIRLATAGKVSSLLRIHPWWHWVHPDHAGHSPQVKVLNLNHKLQGLKCGTLAGGNYDVYHKTLKEMDSTKLEPWVSNFWLHKSLQGSSQAFGGSPLVSLTQERWEVARKLHLIIFPDNPL